MAERLPPIDLDLSEPRRATPGPVDLNLGEAPTTLAGAAVAGASAAADLAHGVPLAGDAAGGATAQGDLSFAGALAGAATAGASAQAGLDIGVQLGGAATGAAQAGADLLAGPPVPVLVAVQLRRPAVVITAATDLAMPRGPSLIAGGAWAVARPSAAAVANPWRIGTPAKPQTAAPWQPGRTAGALLRCPTGALSRAVRPQVAAKFGPGTRQGRATAARWRVLDTTYRPEARAPWGAATPAGTGAAVHWITLYRHARPTLAVPWGAARRAGIQRTAPHRVGTPAKRAWALPWGEGTDRYGWGSFVRFPDPPEPPDPPCYDHPVGVVNLDLSAAIQTTPGPVLLALVCPYQRQTYVVPTRRSYIVVTTASLARLSDGANIPCASLSLSIDADSWGWQFSARCPASALPLLDGGPLRARINGVDWHVVVDTVARARQFPGEQITLTGRGLAAELAAPLAVSTTRVSTAQRTAQQLAAEALPAEWSLDWQAPDWLVPAGAWSHQGTPIEAVLAVAGAVRAVVQAARAERTIAVLPRWPVAPWDLPTATPDVVLPLNPVVTLSESRSEAAPLNAVYVSGTAQGIVARVWRSGTAGDLLASQVSDALITATEAARARGIAELAAGGEQAEVQIELPLAPAASLPLLEIGQIVQVGESPAWLGLVRGSAVTADGASARQRVTLDRRF